MVAGSNPVLPFFLYFLEKGKKMKEYNSGLVLKKNEVKTIKKQKIDIKGKKIIKIAGIFYLSYKTKKNNGLIKMLLKKKEIKEISSFKEKRKNVVPIKIFIKNNIVKLKIGIKKIDRSEKKKKQLKNRDLLKIENFFV